MVRSERLLTLILRGSSDEGIPFDGLLLLLRRLGFDERIRGDHHIFTRHDIIEILNLQPRGGKAKPYQLRQVRQVITRHGLGGNFDEK